MYVGLTIYQCSTNHTSGSSTKPGVGGSWATDWNQQYWVASLVQPWATGTNYAVGAATWVSSAFYVCTAAHTSGSTTAAGSWGQLAIVLGFADRDPGQLHIQSQFLLPAHVHRCHNVGRNQRPDLDAAGDDIPDQLSRCRCRLRAVRCRCDHRRQCQQYRDRQFGNDCNVWCDKCRGDRLPGISAASNSTAIGAGQSCNSTSSYSTAIRLCAACTSCEQRGDRPQRVSHGQPINGVWLPGFCWCQHSCIWRHPHQRVVADECEFCRVSHRNHAESPRRHCRI